MRTFLTIFALTFSSYLSAENLVIQLDEDVFQDKISKGVTLVDFYADWCPPCRRLAPTIGMIAEEMEGRASVAKLNVDQAKALSSQLRIRALPTLVVFKDGKEVTRHVGAPEKKQIVEMIERAL